MTMHDANDCPRYFKLNPFWRAPEPGKSVNGALMGRPSPPRDFVSLPYVVPFQTSNVPIGIVAGPASGAGRGSHVRDTTLVTLSTWERGRAPYLMMSSIAQYWV